ncbi:ABC transporter ATP-binding protein [Faunimonas sp. B44]|uniref:ABC transporter ATP-binding protein n=1 Tax=Faunimonas sp. B44 TaxID=3461493 RepID=UPI004044502B
MSIHASDDCICRIEDLGVAIDGDVPVALVDGISFEIRKGDYFALVGESGSGKSITCHAMMRLLPFKPKIDGRILIDGQDVWSLNRRKLLAFRRKSVGMVFQDPLAALNPVRTIGSQMLEALQIHYPAADADELRNRTVQALRDVHIPEPGSRLGVYPHQLSGGLNQRVMIALALIGNPKLLIADEPTTALDMSVQAEVLNLIDELRRKNDLTVLLVTHDLGIVRDRATHIAVLQNGKMVEQGLAADVANRPKASYSKELFAASSVDWPGRGETRRSREPLCLTFNMVNKTFFASKKDRTSGVGIPAAKNMSFTVRRGEIVALIGESGSGKTTAAKMAMKLETPDSGDIILHPSPRDFKTPLSVQMVFQHPRDSLDPLMRVEDQLHEVLKVHGWKDKAKRHAHILKTIGDVGLGVEVLGRRPTFLSGGEAQRVVIARALLLEPDMLIADEPLSAVDVRIQKQILGCLQRLRERLGIAILLITHDLRVVFEIADQVVVLRYGRVVEDVPVAMFSDGARDEYTQKLIDAVPGKAGHGVADDGPGLAQQAGGAMMMGV